MFLGQKAAFRFLATAMIGGSLLLSAMAAPPDGKGKGGGGDDPLPPPIAYDILWLVEGEETTTYPFGVNRDGIVVGSQYDAFGPYGFIYFLSTGQILDLNNFLSNYLVDDLAGAHIVGAHAINDAGRIAGILEDADDVWRVFVYDFPDGTEIRTPSTPAHTLPILPILSEDGVVSASVEFGGEAVPFVWFPDQDIIQWLPTPSVPTGINSGPDRVVVGTSADGVWRYHSASNTLDVLTDTRVGQAYVNDLGEVAANNSVGKKKRKVVPQVYRDGLGWEPLTAENARVAGINASGQVFGHIPGSVQIPDTMFLYDPTDGYWPMDDLVDDTPEELELWFFGDWRNDIRPHSISNAAVDGYPVITGYKFGVGWFVLTPFTPAP
jgi:hypothetical protein